MIIEVRFTEADVESIAAEAGVPVPVALERAEEWGRYIEQTVSELAAEQLASAITTGQV